MNPTAPALDTETAGQLRTVIGRLARRLRTTAAAREAGLTPTGISVLLNVNRTGPCRMSELAEAEGLNPTMLSRVVSDLGASGLTERFSDLNDRRAAWVDITKKGRRLAERMRSERTEAVNAAMRALSGDERQRIERALPALEALVEELKERRP
ncbi:MAG: MarR family winged helix-turn-helix transcriptional regulator [Solirubrobacteraceae bacterium]